MSHIAFLVDLNVLRTICLVAHPPCCCQQIKRTAILQNETCEETYIPGVWWDVNLHLWYFQRLQCVSSVSKASLFSWHCIFHVGVKHMVFRPNQTFSLSSQLIVSKSEFHSSENSLFTLYMHTVVLLYVSCFSFSFILMFKLLSRWEIEELRRGCVTQKGSSIKQ